MIKKNIDILNECHTKHIKGMESIHTKYFPSVYTETALDAMDVFSEQQSVNFFNFVKLNFYEGNNGYVINGDKDNNSGLKIKQLYKIYITLKK